MSVYPSINIIFQIPYIKLGLTDDLYEFSNDKLAQFVIILDILGMVFTKGLLFMFFPSNNGIFSYVFDTMASFRAIGYFLVAYDYMQWHWVKIRNLLYNNEI